MAVKKTMLVGQAGSGKRALLAALLMELAQRESAVGELRATVRRHMPVCPATGKGIRDLLDLRD